MEINNYPKIIQEIKSAILKSRYRAAALANRELLSLYYGIGKYISENSRKGFWGTRAIETISDKLQQELPGLRGFSAGNIKKMRLFFEEWCECIENRTLVTYDLEQANRSLTMNEFRQPLADDIQDDEDENLSNRLPVANDLQSSISEDMTNRALPTHEIEIGLLTEIQSIDLHCFLLTGFSHHYEIIKKTKSLEERLFYIERCATEFWSVETLKYHLKSNLFASRGKLPNNFQTTISDKDLQRKALLSFKDEYLLDHINIESPDDEPDERVLESAIVNNIRKFIMALGKDFSFIGNQYRITVDVETHGRASLPPKYRDVLPDAEKLKELL